MITLSSGTINLLNQAADDLWSTFATNITIVKKASVAAIDTSITTLPGYGFLSRESNYIYTPEQKSFPCLKIADKPTDAIDFITDKVQAEGDILIKVQQAARDYILDGRPNEHAIYKNKTYSRRRKKRSSS